jgi:hypothetical protein
MAWMGQGALVAWHDVEAGQEAEYRHWHSHEHMQERLAIPGFLHGFRYAAVSSGPQYLIIYEVADMAVFTSPAYLERLNNPSEWTRRMMPFLRGMNRSLCRVVGSFGLGAGRYMQTSRFSPTVREQIHLAEALSGELRVLADEPFLTGAHLLVADPEASTAPTQERQLRGGQDEVADCVLLVEGFDGEAVSIDRSECLLRVRVGGIAGSDLYEIEHVV